MRTPKRHRGGNGEQSSGRFSKGYYFVQFDRAVSFCGYVATTDGYAGPTGTVQGAAYGYPQEVFVYTGAGTERVDLPFHVAVHCWTHGGRRTIAKSPTDRTRTRRCSSSARRTTASSL